MNGEEDLVTKYKLKRPETPAQPTGAQQQSVSEDQDLTQRYNLRPLPRMGSEVEGPPMPTEEQMPRDYGKAVKAGVMQGAAGIPGQFGDVQQLINTMPSTAGELGLRAVEKFRQQFNLQDSPEYKQSVEQAREALGGMQKFGENLRYYNLPNLAFQALPEGAREWVREKTGIQNIVAPTTGEISKAVDPYAQQMFGVGPEYQPRTPEEKLAKEAASFGTQGIVGPGRLGMRVLTGTAAGAGGEYARQKAEGTAFETPAQLAGSLIAGTAPSVAKETAKTVLMPKTRAAEALGDVTSNYNVESAYPTRLMAQNFDLKEIAETTPDRMRAFTKQLTGVQQDLPPLQKLIEDAATSERTRVYDIAKTNPAAQSIDNMLFADLMQRPDFVKAMNKAMDVAKNAPEFGIVPPTPNSNGNLAYWDHVKRILNEEASNAMQSSSERSATKASYLQDMQKNLVKILDETIPEYPVARDVASNTFTATNAPEAGMKFMGNIDVFDKDAIANAIKSYSPAQRTLFNVGVMQTVTDAIERGGLNNLSKKFITNREFQDKLRTAMGDESYSILRGKILSENMINRAWDLQQKIGMQGALSKNKSAIASGTMTAAAATSLFEAQMLTQFLQSVGVSPEAVISGLAVGAAASGAKAIKNVSDRRIVGEMLELVSKGDVKSFKRINELTQKHPDLYQAILGPTIATEVQENREGRATGGKVGGSIAQRLVDEAAKAHKYHQKTTEEILDAPDEHVVKALAVANKHI